MTRAKTPEDIGRDKKAISRRDDERKYADEFGDSSGKRQTKKIKRGTPKNGSESSSFC